MLFLIRFSMHFSEHPIPAIDATNVVFSNGVLHVDTSEESFEKITQDFSKFYGSKQSHLPSNLVQVQSTTDWIAGPKLQVSAAYIHILSIQS